MFTMVNRNPTVLNIVVQRVRTKSHRSGSCRCEAPSHGHIPCSHGKCHAMADGLAEAATVVPSKTARIEFDEFSLPGHRFSPNQIVFYVS